jgi:hypothetical protein
VFTKHGSRHYVNSTLHHTMFLFLSAIIARDEHFKSPFCHGRFLVVKVRMLAKNVINHVPPCAGYLR